MKMLVTGALGHIGSQLIHSLQPGDFDEVILVDNLATQRYCSLFHLPEKVPFRFVEMDICTGDLDACLDGVDVVIHLAAITNAEASFQIAQQVEQVNYEGAARVAYACLKCGCRLFFPSTTSVYGTQAEVVDETCALEELKPQSPYAASKLKAEQRLQELAGSAGLRAAICRLGTIFGASIGMRFHTAVNKFIWQACLGQPVTVWRTAMNQKRPYLELNDAVRAIKFIIDADLFDGQVYNIVSNNAAVADIVEIIRSSVPDLQVQYVDTPIMNLLSYNAANEKFCRLGFRFEGRIQESIAEAIQWIHGVRQHSLDRTVQEAGRRRPGES